ncbi:ClcB-like voltage-gated chloride channel protein [Limnobacter litoralis]|uniref:Voltage-gated chloride channel n=1 Tax=Limnobacter litoralis TaxID=481366 RepID=A0ABQ5YR56_9BURK|nr:ClcB-like voltage-gated chloride channel protein [Limnobacter litoralis]GLR27008.1 voltage-gated chloride channel [Limnobacter litoralis]
MSLYTRFLSLRLRLLELFRLSRIQPVLLWAVLIGLLGAFSTFLFREAIAGLQWLFTRHPGSMVGMAMQLNPTARLWLPTIGGLVAGLLLAWARRVSAERRSDYMEAIAVGDGHLPVRHSLLRSVSSLFSVASGGSIGREGSMVQLSALIASVLGSRLRLDRPQLRLLVACGAAAGVTSAYNTPLAASLFVSEIVLGSIAIDTLGPMLLASVVANVTMRALPNYHPVYAMPTFAGLQGLQVLWCVPLGLFVGAMAPFFLRTLAAGKRLFESLSLPLPIRLAVGGFLVGAISVWVPQVWGNGYSVVNSLLHQPWLWSSVLLVLVTKVLATTLTTGSGAVGGVFTPTLFVGAALGWLFGAAAMVILPAQGVLPSAFAVVGMGAFLAATTGAPLMAIFMIFEMTLSDQVVLPLMVACVIAFWVARNFGGGRWMYEVVTQRNREEQERTRLEGQTMADLVQPADTVLTLDDSVSAVMQMFFKYPVKYVYLVDSKGWYQGVVSLKDVSEALTRDPLIATQAVAPFLKSGEIPVLLPAYSLSEGLTQFMQHFGERLPVVHSHEQPLLMGVVHKSAILETFSVLGRQPAAVASSSLNRDNKP